MTIASRLDEAMKAAGFKSQNALARASGIPQPTINRILKGVGKKGPEAHTLAQLAAACNVAFDWLHEGIGDRARTVPKRGDGEKPIKAIAPQIPENFVDADEFVKLMILFRQSTASGRRQIMGAAESADKAISAGGDLAAEN